MISIVRGNDFTLKIPVDIQTGVDESGKPIVYPLDLAGYDVGVVIRNQFSRLNDVLFNIEGSTILIDIDGTKISNGIYDVEIKVKKDNNMRSMKRKQFRIVESNEESNLSPDAEFSVEIHQLYAQTLVDYGSGGSEGVTDYNRLSNRPKIAGTVLTGNLSLRDLSIQPEGNYVSDPNYVHTDNNFTRTLKEKLESLSNYDDATIQEEVRMLEQSLNTLVSGDVNGVIDSFHEIEAFLSGVTESDSLTKMLSDLRTEIVSNIPTKVSQLINDNNYTSKSYVDGLVGNIGSMLDTINGEVI